jgi:hexosaminidase
MRGLETFSQLVTMNSQKQYGVAGVPVSIKDKPTYSHRGLMIDSGRRFVPLVTVKKIMDGMVASKLNVLHLHASDHCRFAVESKLYPALTAGLVGDQAGFYTQDDVKAMVSYAGDRMIRVVPEFDFPGHSKGLAPLGKTGDLKFCTPVSQNASQLYNDPAGVTLGTLKALLGEMAGLFPDEAVINIGADETGVKGVCTDVKATFALERSLVEHITTKLGRTAQGWEELLFDAAAGSAGHPSTLPEGTIVAGWKKHRAAEIVQQGFNAIENHEPWFYLNKKWPLTAPWADIGSGGGASGGGGGGAILGGEVAMWTDNYCYIQQCGAQKQHRKPVGAALYPPSKDAEFERSLSAMIFPGASVGAGSFWNFDKALDANSKEFTASITAHTARLIGRGVIACPPGCVCDEVSQCGKPYLL